MVQGLTDPPLISDLIQVVYHQQRLLIRLS